MNQIHVLMEEHAVHMVSTLIHVIVHLALLVEIVKLVSDSWLLINEKKRINHLVDPCIPNPCQNSGQCRPNLVTGTYVCDCLPDFLGKNCEIRKWIEKCFMDNSDLIIYCHDRFFFQVTHVLWIHVAMVANVVLTNSVVSHVCVCLHLLDRDVKIVSLVIYFVHLAWLLSFLLFCRC